MHHLSVGYHHRGTRILALADDTTVTIIALHTGEVLSTHTIDPTRNYWRNQQNPPADGQKLQTMRPKTRLR